jgi:hypothetical protein
VAVSVWGRPRYTADLDIVVEIKSTNQTKDLVGILLKKIKNSYIDQEAAIDAFNHKSEFNLIETKYGLKADFFVIGQDEHQKLELKRGKKRRIGGEMIKFISPEDLIIAKLGWYQEGQSDKQFEDILAILEAGNINQKYLDLWIKNLGLEKEWQKLEKYIRN